MLFETISMLHKNRARKRERNANTERFSSDVHRQVLAGLEISEIVSHLDLHRCVVWWRRKMDRMRRNCRNRSATHALGKSGRCGAKARVVGIVHKKIYDLYVLLRQMQRRLL